MDAQQAFDQMTIVVLVSFGMYEEGYRWLQREFPCMPWDAVIHRIDEVFNHTIRLCRRGTHWRAQNQFKQLYNNYEEFLEEATRQVLLDARNGNFAHFYACAHGHHRSVCFVELLSQYLRRWHSHLTVVVHHLDHWQANLQDLRGLSQDDYEDYFEEPLANRSHVMPDSLITNWPFRA